MKAQKISSFPILVVIIHIITSILCYSQPWNFVNTSSQFFEQVPFYSYDYILTKVSPNYPNQKSLQKIALWNTTKINLNNDFVISFRSYFGADPSGADGIAFVLQNQGTSALGSWGAGIGYASCKANCVPWQSDSIAPSLVVEFDTFYDYLYSPNEVLDMHDANDYRIDHIAVLKDGIQSNPLGGNVAAAYVTSGLPPNIDDDLWHCITIGWTASTQTISVYFDYHLRKTLDLDDDYNLNLISHFGTNEVWWGLTASTGDHESKKEVQIKTVNNQYHNNVNIQIDDLGQCDPFEYYKVCKNDDVKLTANFDEENQGISYTWYDLSNPTIPIGNTQIIHVYPSTTITYKVRATYAGSIAEQQITITVIDPAITNIDVINPQSIHFDINNPKLYLCKDNNISLKAKPDTRNAEEENIEYTWDITTECESILEEHNHNTLPWIGNPFAFKFTQNFSQCTLHVHSKHTYKKTPNSEDSYCTSDLYIPILPPSLTVLPVIICKGDKLIIEVTVKDENGNVIDDGNLNYVWTGYPAQTSKRLELDKPYNTGLYEVTVQLKDDDGNPSNGTGCTGTGSILVDNLFHLDLETTFNCENLQEYEASIMVTPSVGPPPYTYTWLCNCSIPPINITEQNITTPSETHLFHIPYGVNCPLHIDVIDARGCHTTKDIVLNNVPFTVTMDAMPNSICNGSCTLHIHPTNGYFPINYELFDNNSYAPPPLQTTNSNITDNTGFSYFTVTSAGHYYLKAIDAQGCIAYSDIIVLPQREMIICAAESLAVCAGEEIQMIVDYPDYQNGDFIRWTPTDGLDDPTAKRPYARPENTQTYTVTYKTQEGCSTSANVTVNVIKPDNDFLKKLYSQWDGCAKTFYPGIERISDCNYIVYGSQKLPTIWFNFLQKFDKNGTFLNIYGSTFSVTWNENMKTSFLKCFNLSPCLNNAIPQYCNYNEISRYLLTGAAGNDWNLFWTCIMEYNLNLTPIKQILIHYNNEICELPTKTIQCTDNNLLIIGTYFENANVGDIIVTKLNNNMNQIIWAKRYGIAGWDDRVNDVIETESHDFLLCGSIQENANIKTLVLKLNGLTGEILLAKKLSAPTQGCQNYLSQGNAIIKQKNLSDDNYTYIIGGDTRAFEDCATKNIQLFRIDENLNLFNGSRRIYNNNGGDVKLQSILNNDFKSFSLYGSHTINGFDEEMDIMKINRNFEIELKKNYLITEMYNYAFPRESLIYVHTKNNIFNVNTSGIAFSAAYNCGPYNEPIVCEYHEFMFFGQTSTLYTSTGCDHNPDIVSTNYSIEDAPFTQTEIDNYNLPYTPIISTVPFDTYNNPINFNNTNACTTEISPICYCDDSKIAITISPDIEGDDCCFKIEFTNYANETICGITQARITADGMNAVTVNLTNGSSNGFTTFCFTNSFTGLKTLTINYLNALGDVKCSTNRDIYCGCTCDDYKVAVNQLELRLESSSENDEQCCYDFYLDNGNLCAFKEQGIEFIVPTGMDVNDFIFTPDNSNGWTEVIISNTTILLHRGNNQIPTGSGFKIGTLCVPKTVGAKAKTFTFYIKSENCQDMKTWRFDLSCNKEPCCNNYNVNVVPASDQGCPKCCYTAQISVTDPNCFNAAILTLTPSNGNPPETFPSNIQNGTFPPINFCVYDGDNTVEINLKKNGVTKCTWRNTYTCDKCNLIPDVQVTDEASNSCSPLNTVLQDCIISLGSFVPCVSSYDLFNVESPTKLVEDHPIASNNIIHEILHTPCNGYTYHMRFVLKDVNGKILCVKDFTVSCAGIYPGGNPRIFVHLNSNPPFCCGDIYVVDHSNPPLQVYGITVSLMDLNQTVIYSNYLNPPFNLSDSTGMFLTNYCVPIDSTIALCVRLYDSSNTVISTLFSNCSCVEQRQNEGRHIIPNSGEKGSEDRIINNLSVRPNPANNKIFIDYSLLKDAEVSVDIYDVLGHKKLNVDNGIKKQNIYSYKQDIEELVPGLYYVVVKAHSQRLINSFIITR